MRASMTAGGRERCKSIECIWGDPNGALGALTLSGMAFKNGRQNKAALNLLAPRPGDSVLELGCGPGMGLRDALKRVGREGFVAGVDHSGTAAHFAAHVVHDYVRAGRAAVMRAEAVDLPFRDHMFDRAFAVNSFQFWSDPARSLREITRALAPNGRLVITQRAANLDRPSNFLGAARGMERIGQATALLKSQGWQIIDERCDRDGDHLLAVSVLAERPA